MHSNTIALALSKGGSGKTTTAVNLGHGLALQGRRVCLVDCDTQAHLAVVLGVTVRPGHTLAEVLTSAQKFARCAVEARENLWLVPSEKTSLARAKLAMAQEVTALLGEIRQHREAEGVLELRAILRLVVEGVTVDGESYQIHYRREVRPYFTQET